MTYDINWGVTFSEPKELIIMMTAKVFENGRSQAVRLSKERRFNTDEVNVNKIGDIYLLMPKANKWSMLFVQNYHLLQEHTSLASFER